MAELAGREGAMTILRDFSQLWAMMHVLVVFLLLFESRRSWWSTILVCSLGAAVMSVTNVVAASVLGLSPNQTIFFTCSLPSMALFFSISKYRDGRFFFLFCLSDTMCIWLIQVTSLLDMLAGGGYVMAFFSRLFFFPLAEWVIWKYLRDPYQELQRKLDRGWWMFSLIGLLYYMLAVMLAIPLDAPVSSLGVLPQLLLVLALMPLTYLAILHSLWRQMRMYENVRLMELQRQDYDALCQKMEVGRIYRHDMHHHLAVLEGLIQRGDNSGALQYARSLSGNLEAASEPARCANAAINAVLTAYIVQAANAGCTVETKLRVPEKLPFEDTDICVILANALENAIHACAELTEERRRIELGMELTENRRLIISVENPCPRSVAFGPDGLPDVPKREGHGLGLPSVRKVAEKYGGLFRCQWEKGSFILRAVLMPPMDPGEPREKRRSGWTAAVLAALLFLILLNCVPALAGALEPVPVLGPVVRVLELRTYVLPWKGVGLGG